jgi:hypothetical protein
MGEQTIKERPTMPEPMRAITLWEPWASLLAIGAKRTETRSWATRYRGPVAIHAGIDPRGLRACAGDGAIEDALAGAGLALERLPLGCIVAVGGLVDCRRTEDLVAAGLDDPFGDYGPGRYGWQLDRVRPLRDPIRAIGMQGLWVLPVVLAQQIDARVGADLGGASASSVVSS